MAMKRTHSEVAPSPDDDPSVQGLQDAGPPVKRQLVAVDAGDRAMTYRKPGQQRVLVKEIGFWPNNRGTLGISSRHVHEVAWDCLANKTKLQRYGQVDLVQIPPEMRESFLTANEEKCNSDELMPRFSPDMKYVCASKTHFTHAQKLAHDSMRLAPRTLFNKHDDLVIKWQDTDVEGLEILNSGVMAVIYGAELLRDNDAMCALASGDNLNANVQMGEDEMQAFGRVHALVEKLPPSEERQDSTTCINSIISQVEVAGLGTFTRDNWKHIAALRFSMPAHMAKLFMMCQFDACAGRVRVKPADFGQAARLDPRAPFAMCGVMLSQFLSNPIKTMTASDSGSFEGLRTTFAAKLSQTTITELTQEHEFVLEVESFIKQLLKTYPGGTGITGVAASGLRQERGQLLAACGKVILSVGRSLEAEVRKADARRITLSSDARLKIVNDDKTEKLRKIEENFRSQLVKRKLYTQDQLPNPVQPPANESSQVASSQAQALPKNTQRSITSEGRALTNVDVFVRLQIKGLGEEVMALVEPRAEIKKEEDASDTDQPKRDASTTDEPQANAPREDGRTWQVVTLTSLEIPQAVVTYGKDKEPVNEFAQVWVPVDELRPVPKPKAEPVKKAPHPTLQDGHIKGVALNEYDYVVCESKSKHIMLQHLAMSLHVRSINMVGDVKVYRLSKDGAVPIILQARAQKTFKKGQLALSPLGTILPDDLDTRVLINGFVRGEGKVMHESMLMYVNAAASLVGDKRKNSEHQPSTRYYVMSPVLDAKKNSARESCLENLSPFWAVIGCAGANANHNMELQVTTFRDLGFDAVAASFPKMPIETRFQGEISILRNVRQIEKNDVLCMQAFEHEAI